MPNQRQTKSSDNSKDDLERFERIVDFSENRINSVRNAYVLAASLISAIFVVGITVFSILFFKDRVSIEKEYQEKYRILQEKIEKDLYELKESRLKDYEIVREEIMNRIDQEFRKENINLLVHEKAKERIDLIADSIINRQIQNQIIPLKNDFNDSLQYLDIKIQIALVNADSREAWDRIVEYSKTKRYFGNFDLIEFINEKEYDLTSSKKSISGVVQYVATFKKSPLPISKLTFDELIEQYTKTQDKEKKDLLSRVDKESPLDETEKIRFYLYCLENEKSLVVSYSLAKILVGIYNFDCNTYDFQEIITDLEKIAER